MPPSDAATLLSAAKLDALARVHALRKEQERLRRRALVVPAPFSGAEDFLRAVATLTASIPGSRAEIARQCVCDSKTVSRWMLGRKIPNQRAIDGITAWWRTAISHRDAVPGPSRPAAARRAAPEPQRLSLGRLEASLAARLRRAARLRNIDPLALASQILDRHLPTMESME